jgi:hypothetical protein
MHFSNVRKQMQLYCKPQTYKHDTHSHTNMMLMHMKLKLENIILGSYITIKTHNITIT